MFGVLIAEAATDAELNIGHRSPRKQAPTRRTSESHSFFWLVVEIIGGRFKQEVRNLPMPRLVAGL
jgi:hypothetical protein